MEKAYMLLGGVSQIGGVLIAGAVMIAGMYFGHDLIIRDKAVEGFTAMLTPLALVGAAFLGARKAQQKEKERKAQAERG